MGLEIPGWSGLIINNEDDTMKKYLSAKTIFPVFLLIFEGYWLKLTSEIKTTVIDAGAFATSASFPRFILTAMMTCTLATLIFELRWISKHPNTEESDPQSWKDTAKVLILAVLIAAYVLFFNRLGFIVSTTVMMLIANVLYGQRSKVLTVAISVFFPVFLYAVFRYALKIMLPTLVL